MIEKYSLLETDFVKLFKKKVNFNRQLQRPSVPKDWLKSKLCDFKEFFAFRFDAKKNTNNFTCTLSDSVLKKKSKSKNCSGSLIFPHLFWLRILLSELGLRDNCGANLKLVACRISAKNAVSKLHFDSEARALFGRLSRCWKSVAGPAISNMLGTLFKNYFLPVNLVDCGSSRFRKFTALMYIWEIFQWNTLKKWIYTVCIFIQ